jgi:hypothetical protein
MLVMKNFYPLLICIPFLTSCTKEITPGFKDYAKEVVVNSLLVPDSFLTVLLSESLRSDKEEIFPLISDAEVEISDGKNPTKLLRQGNGKYLSGINPLPGAAYSLKIVTRDGKQLNASTKIPEQPQISITPLADEKLVQITIKDNPEETNFYWIGKKNYSFSRGTENETYIFSDFLLFDEFNRSKYYDINNKFTYEYHFYARLEDTQFNGRSVSFSLHHHWADPGRDHLDYRAYIFIINADRHLDQYMKSALIQYELRVYGDAPIFQTPFDMYSNISNGKGIFGSYTISQFDITEP